MSKGRREVRVRRVIAPEPMAPLDVEAAERLLARVVARAYAANNPHLFGPLKAIDDDDTASGPSPTARADAVAPAARGDGPEKLELEHEDTAH